MIVKIIFNTFFFKRGLNILIPTIFLGLLLSCNMAQNTNDIQIGNRSFITEDSLMHLIRSNFEIVEIELKKDTLLLYSTKDFVYYPYGKYRKFKDFQLSHLTIKDSNYKIDTIGSNFIIINLENQNNIIQFTEYSETDKLELVSAIINDNDLKFNNDIKVGMNKNEFLSLFFTQVPKELEKISVIELASGLLGIWHYYNFSENKLRNITMKTDYLIDD